MSDATSSDSTGRLLSADNIAMTTALTPAYLEELERLCQQLTPCEAWSYDEKTLGIWGSRTVDRRSGKWERVLLTVEDCQFIAAARPALPRLLEALRQMKDAGDVMHSAMMHLLGDDQHNDNCRGFAREAGEKWDALTREEEPPK